MADAAIGFLTEALLTKTVSLAADELSLSFGVKKELTRLSEKLELIQALLSDAQSKQLANEVVKLWLKKLKSIALDAQIVLDDFGYQVLCKKVQCQKRDKVRRFFSSSNPVLFRSKLAHKIRDVLCSIDEVYAESNRIGLQPVKLINSLPDLNCTNRLTDPFVEDSEIVGRDDDSSEVVNMLIRSDYERDLPVVTILGMGGQGKTTLAQVVYKNEKVGSYFDKKVWVCVSDDFNVERLLAQILQSLTQASCELSGREVLVNKLKEQLRDKRYLLVLDDVWNEDRDEWDLMRRCLLQIAGSKGSKVMATTRSEEVASAMRTSGYHKLQILSEEQSFALFEKCAFTEGGATKTPELVAIAKRILKRCGGVPLAIKAIGGMLYSKNCESEWSMIERSELWSSVPSTGASGVLSAIRLSYDHLPSFSLKKCFAYCAIFQKDTALEKDKLVQLWMAQGFLNPPKGSHLLMEDMGDIYFNILLKSSLLQDAGRDWRGKFTFKMHDLVHDLSLHVSESCCINMKDGNVGSSKIEAVHLSIINYRKGMLKQLKHAISSKLRTLHLDGYDAIEGFFLNFRYLTVLTIEDYFTFELPYEICKVTHLRFLDVCRTGIHKLPKSFTELYYFQTLRVNYLDELPEGFGNLINLRHLYVDETVLGHMPRYLIPALGQLTNLQTLPFFKVDKSNGCQIEELEFLDNIRGDLRLFCLENVGSYESALRSNMSKKSNMHTLELHWGKREHDCNDTDVMKGFKPHSNLKGLLIDGYQSPEFPSWMITKNYVMLLRNLVKFTLEGLDSCERLPSLGDLPCLEYLKLGPLPNVKCIQKEFYGCSNIDWERKSSSSDGADNTIFPALRVLKVWGMDSLEEWSDAIALIHPTAKVFPSLEELELMGMPNLCVFPNLGSLLFLQILSINNCQNLTLPSCWNNLMSHELEAGKSPAVIHSSASEEGGFSCPDFDDNPYADYFPSLRKLYIQYCDKLVASFCSLRILAPLKTLCIFGDPSFWPKDLHHLISLETLELRCDSAEIDYFPWPYSISSAPHATEDVQHSISLTSLYLHGWLKVTSLTDQIQHATTLKRLSLWHFGLEALPEWLGNLECLQHLDIFLCQNLKHFPSAKAFQRLTNLEHLTVYKCPLLEERCTEGSGPEWPKIAHVPNVRISS